MKKQLMLCLAGMLFLASALSAGQIEHRYKVLSPISHGNLTIFPVVASSTHDTSQFLTLDEGIRSGEVVVTESGNVAPLIRRRGPYPPAQSSARVNTLVLINNSKRPLLLLAGEIVTGGKQDRVIGKDRIVPPESDPIDLGVFCVEPGRWVARSEKFGTIPVLAQPSVRAKAMVDKDQQKVWDQVAESRSAMMAAAPPPPPAIAGPGTAGGVARTTTSYAATVENTEVKKQIDQVVVSMQQSYSQLMHQLRDRNAVGVVVAVNGEIIWADIFASPSLLEKYWPKLVRSYAAEAMVERANDKHVTEAAAEAFLENLQGNHEVVDTEAGIFRQAEISGSNYKVFELTSLLPNTGFDVHVAKMTNADAPFTSGPLRID
jgi:ARG and Rhodanese-Phosphatase-superfamily-associated Protein domain